MNAYTYGRPALTMGQVNGMQYPQGQPALVDPKQPNPPTPALSGNARGSSKVPSGQIDMRSEGLMRIGAAGLQSASDPSGSGGNWMAAMGQEYGNIQDYNRQAEQEAFAIEESRRLEQARAAALAAKTNKPNKDAGFEAAVASAKYNNAMQVLQGFKDHDGVVGLGYMFRKWDQITGNQRENVRLKIAKLKVDDQLSYIAQTKGAVSDREMAIFGSAQPNWTDGEAIWEVWVRDYAEALRVMNNRLAGGTAVGTYSDGSTSGQFIAGGQSLNAPNAPDTSGYSIVTE